MIQNIITKLKPYRWNERQFNLEDFDYFCKLAEVEVIEKHTGYLGYYDIVCGVPVIILSPSLQGNFKLWVAFHELAHCWLHAPGAGFLYGTNKTEKQADIIASCAVIPRTMLEDLDILMTEDFPASLIELRFEINRHHNF